MTGAMYALAVNILIACLFAVTFLVVARIHTPFRSARWFALSYLTGALTPAAELMVRVSGMPQLFQALSFASFSGAFHLMAYGLTVYYRRRLPGWLLPASFLASLVVRAAIWGGERDTLPYELIYQAPFALIMGFCAAVVAGTGRRIQERILATMFAVLAAHFLIKAFAAVILGSGATARDYAGSTYALFSQAVSGLLLVAAGLTLLIVVMTDMLEQVRRDASIDPLSGLKNRRGFDQRTAAVLAAMPSGLPPPVVLVFDIDHFKRINDGYGHAAGDRVIRMTADVLGSVLPAGAIIARIGGEEFAALLTGLEPEAAAASADAVRTALPHRTIPGLPAEVRVTISGGLADLAPGESVPAALARADGALYDAKRAGRNRIVRARP
jgi:diguanylate cyclase (GGDEF)-like protein